jgi:hypothetical protein
LYKDGLTERIRLFSFINTADAGTIIARHIIMYAKDLIIAFLLAFLFAHGFLHKEKISDMIARKRGIAEEKIIIQPSLNRLINIQGKNAPNADPDMDAP